MFSEATDNEKIKAVYGNYNLWSWLRYWWIDTENWITFMLMDKSYYDYDYEKPSKSTMAALTEAKSDDELIFKLRGMGFSVRTKNKLTPEELQAEVMKEQNNSNGR